MKLTSQKLERLG